MAETERKKRRKKPTEAVRKRRAASPPKRKDGPKAKGGGKNKPKEGKPRDPAETTSSKLDPGGGGAPSGGGGGSSTASVNATLGGAGVAATTAAAEDRPGGRSPAQAASQALADYGPSGSDFESDPGYEAPPTGTQIARAEYRRKMRAHREYMQDVRQLISRVKSSDKEHKAEERAILEKALKDPRSKVPEKDPSLVINNIRREGERWFRKTSENPHKVLAAALGKQGAKKAEDFAQQFVQDAEVAAYRREHGTPKEVNARKTIKAYYEKAPPATKNAMRDAGLAPGEELKMTVRHQAVEAAGDRQYRRKKQANVVARAPSFRDYRTTVETDVEDRALRKYEEKVGRELFPKERKLVARAALRGQGVKQMLDRSERALEMFGAYPAQGEKFQQALDDAMNHGNAQQRAVAKAWELRLRYNTDPEVEPKPNVTNPQLSQAERSVEGRKQAQAGVYGIVDRKKGDMVMLTPDAYGKALKKQIFESKAVLHEAKVDTVGEVFEAGWEELKAFANPDTWVQLGEAGVELVGNAPSLAQSAINRVTGGNPAPPSMPRVEAMLKDVERHDPLYPILDALASGKSLVDALDESGSRAAAAPITTLGYVGAATRLAHLGVLKAKYGHQAQAVAVARPSFLIEDRPGQKTFSEMTPGERLAEIRARRASAREAQKHRSREARRDAQKYGGTSSSHLKPEAPPGEGYTRQFYSPSMPVRTAQKAYETGLAAVGKHPYNKTGRRAGGWFDSRVGGAFRKLGGRVVTRARATNLKLGAEIQQDVRDLMVKPVRKLKVLKSDALDLAAFALRYDGRVNVGTEAADLDALIQTNQRLKAQGSEVWDSEHLETFDSNVEVLEELKEDLQLGPEAKLNKNDLVGRVEELQGQGLKIDAALEAEQFITGRQGAGRRAIPGPIAREEVARIEEGEVLPEEREKRITAQTELDVAQAVNVVKEKRKAQKEAGTETRAKPVPEEPRKPARAPGEAKHKEKARTPSKRKLSEEEEAAADQAAQQAAEEGHEPRPARETKPVGAEVEAGSRKVVHARAKVRVAQIMRHLKVEPNFWKKQEAEGKGELAGRSKAERGFDKIKKMSLDGQVRAFDSLLAEAKGFRDRADNIADEASWARAVGELEKLAAGARKKLNAETRRKGKAEPVESEPEPEGEALAIEGSESLAALDYRRRVLSDQRKAAPTRDKELEIIEKLKEIDEKIAVAKADQARGVKEVRRRSPGLRKAKDRERNASDRELDKALEDLEEKRRIRDKRLAESDDPVAKELRRLDREERAYAELLARERGYTGGVDRFGEPLREKKDVTEPEESFAAKRAALVSKELGVDDYLGSMRRALEPRKPSKSSDWITTPDGASKALTGLLAKLRSVMRKEDAEGEQDFGEYQEELKRVEAQLGDAAYRWDAIERLEAIEAQNTAAAWYRTPDIDNLTPDQRATLRALGVGVPGQRIEIGRDALNVLEREWKISVQEVREIIRQADVKGIANYAARTAKTLRHMAERRLARGEAPQGEALDEFHERVATQGAIEDEGPGQHIRQNLFEEALQDLFAADRHFRLDEFLEAVKAVETKWVNRGKRKSTAPGSIQRAQQDLARRQLANKVKGVVADMIRERQAKHTWSPRGEAHAESQIERIQEQRRATRKRAYDLLNEPMQVAKRDGWIWVKGDKMGQFFNETVGGGFFDYGALNAGLRGSSRELTPESAGALESPEPIVTTPLAESGKMVRRSFDAQVRILGLMRLKRALIEISPFKRAMDQDEAAVLLSQMNVPGQPRYAMVPAGKGGEIDVNDVDEFMDGIERQPKPGEPVIVVPVAIQRVLREVTKPPTRTRAVAQYLSQKYVQAVLPFSVVWQMGNIIDLATRLAISGVNWVDDPKLAKELRSLIKLEDPILEQEMFDWLVGHYGSREGQINTANVTQLMAGGKSQMSRNISNFFAKLNENRLVRGLQPIRWTAQRLFDVATFNEEFFIRAGMGLAARNLAKDLGYEIRDTVALAERLADELHTNPRLLEEFGERVVSIVGDYSSSAFGHNVMQSIDPFWTWVRESAKFVFYTFPAKHPLKFALAVTLANMQQRVAEQYGLNEYLDGFLSDLPPFLRGGIPVGGTIGYGPLSPSMSAIGADEGWFRPLSPMTSWGEALKMIDNPVGYLAGRPFPYLQRSLSVARGHRNYTTIGELGVRNFQSWLGVDIPGFDPPSTIPLTEYTGDRTLGLVGELVKSFVPGANQVDELLRGGSQGTSAHNLFRPEPLEAASVHPLESIAGLLESRVLNPFGKVRDLSAIGYNPFEELSRKELIDRYGVTTYEEMAEERGLSEHKQANAENEPKIGAVLYTDHGTTMVYNGRRWVKGHDSEANNRVQPHQVRQKGSSKNVSKPSKQQKDAALKKLEKMFPEVVEQDPRSLHAIADAARNYDVPPEVLAGIFDIETDFGRLDLPGVSSGANSAGAMGRMQFMPGTWDAYGVDGDKDGKADPYNSVDAIHSAANYLSASGAKDDLYGAIFAYNHADWYVQDVLARADHYKTSKWIDAGVGSSVGMDAEAEDTVRKIKGSWAGSRRSVLRAIPKGFKMSDGTDARAAGRSDKRTPEENAAVGGATNSDHLTTNTLSYAADISPATSGDGHSDELAAEIAKNLGMASSTGTNQVVKDGYEYTLIWQDEGHYDHIHLGAEWVGDSKPPTGTYAGGPVPTSSTVTASSSGGYTATGSGGGTFAGPPQAMLGNEKIVTGNPAMGAKLAHRMQRFRAERVALVMQLFNDEIDETTFVTELNRAAGYAGI